MLLFDNFKIDFPPHLTNINMNRFLVLILYFFLCAFSSLRAQRLPEGESAVVTTGEVTVKGKRFPYTATAGTQPVWNHEGKISASVFYTYYERSDVKDRTSRPLILSFNGGPGSASVWMHVAYTGPRILEIDDEGYPVQPYGVKENPFSILDVADIVFIDPVNTGSVSYTHLTLPTSP
jgi:carboxypeptidase C (cathepsin A)